MHFVCNRRELFILPRLVSPRNESTHTSYISCTVVAIPLNNAASHTQNGGEFFPIRREEGIKKKR